MLIAVTGVNGFIGGSAARRLLREGHSVLAFGRRSECAVPGVDYVRWDITSGPIDRGRFDAVVHCAGSVTEWGSAREFRAANVLGTRHVLESFRDAGMFVHLSSASVYDLTVAKVAIGEDEPPARTFVTPYSPSKIEAERLVRQRDGGWIILRPHIVYGPGEAKILPRLLRVLRSGLLLVPGDGRNRVSPTHVDNLTDVIAGAVEMRDAHEVVNIADAETPSIDELLSSLQLAFGTTADIRHVPFGAAWAAAVASESLHRTLLRFRTPALTRFLVAQLAFDFTLDISRAAKKLGYAPRRSFPEAFKELALLTRAAGGRPTASPAPAVPPAPGSSIHAAGPRPAARR